MPPRRLTVDTPAGRIGFREAGTGPATLVLLHGLSGNSLSWESQFDHLANHRRVIAWDSPGYGGSDDPPTPAPGPDDYVEALGNFLDALGIARMDLLGHSMGGIVAARFAARWPERVRALVLSCTSADFTPAGAGFAARIAELRTLDSEEFGRRRADGMAAPDTPERVRQQLAEIAATARLPGFEAAARMLGEADNRTILPSIACPVLVVAGREDSIAPVAEADRLAGLVRGACRVVIDGAGHAPYAERPDSYNAAVAAFLRAARSRG